MGDKDLITGSSEESANGLQIKSKGGVMKKILDVINSNSIDTEIDVTRRKAMITTAQSALNATIAPQAILEGILPSIVGELEQCIEDMPNTFDGLEEKDRAEFITSRLSLLYRHPVIIEDWSKEECMSLRGILDGMRGTVQKLKDYGINEIHGISIDVAFRHMIINRIKWEKITDYSKVPTASMKYLVEYVPTQHLAHVLESYLELTPRILRKTIHVHEGFNILPYLQTSFSEYPERLSHWYCDPEIIIHYPSNTFFMSAIQHIKNTLPGLFTYHSAEGFNTLIEIIFHESDCISENVREEAKDYLIKELEKSCLAMYKGNEANSGVRYINTSYKSEINKIMCYLNQRGLLGRVRFPELKEQFDRITNADNLSDVVSDERRDRDITNFLDSIS